MKAIIKRFLAVFLSLFLIIAPTIQQANAASSWGITSAVSAGARTVVTATKSGYKSAVNIAPTAGRLGSKLIKGRNMAALGFAVVQILGDGIDWTLDPANNSIKYTGTSPTDRYYWQASGYSKVATGATPVAAGTALCQSLGWSFFEYNVYGEHHQIVCKDASGNKEFGAAQRIENPAKLIPIDVVAAKVISNANAGHAASQAATRETATEMVIGGQFDQDLLQGAVPTSDTKPLIPAVPGNGNGNVTHGSDVGIGEGGTTGATPGQQADAAKDAADASKKAAEAAADAAKAAAEDARKAADDAQDLINSGADQAAIDAANDRAKAAEKAAADSKGAADAATKAAAERARAAEAAADRARIDADARAKAAEAAADAAIAAEKAAAAAEKAAAKAAADAAIQAAERARAEADARAKAAEEAAKAADRAKAEAAKPFELPAFCTWAAIVCETAEWLKREPETPEITAIDTDSPIDDFDSDKSYITFTGSCPPKYTASLSIMGATAPFEFDYTPICTVMSYLKPFIVGAGYIAAAYIIAGHSRGSKD